MHASFLLCMHIQPMEERRSALKDSGSASFCLGGGAFMQGRSCPDAHRKHDGVEEERLGGLHAGEPHKGGQRRLRLQPQR